MDIQKIISDSVENIGYELIECEHNQNNGLIRIFIDNGDIISVEDCVKVSNHLNRVLSVELDYDFSRLEVSSPGVDRKLIKIDDFERFNGEKIKVKLYSPIENQKKYQGKIIMVGSHGASWTSWPGIDLDRLLYNNSKLALREFVKGVAQSGMCLASLTVFEPSKFKSSMNEFTGGEIRRVVERLVDIINDTSTDLLHVEMH